MRIKAINLSWFRGAAESATLEPDCKSMVVYGANASGKSSFIDAVEYVLNGGRVGHLAHEYSGKNLKNALPNTHKPNGVKAWFSLEFCNGSELRVEIEADGSARRSGAMVGAIGSWDYRRTVLRQDEVVGFIHETKGGKYSALLPLFGLQPMEVCAENLRQLGKNVESLSQIPGSKAALNKLLAKRVATFAKDSDGEILKKIDTLHRKYQPHAAIEVDGVSRCVSVAASIQERISRLSAEQARHLILGTVAGLGIRTHLGSVRAANSALAGAIEPLIAERIAILQPAESLIGKLPGTGEVICPACGRSLPVGEFRQHVRTELERLREVRNTFNARSVAMADLSEGIKSLRTQLSRKEVTVWREAASIGTLSPCFDYLRSVSAEALRTKCTEEDLQEIEARLLPLIDAAASDVAPPDVQDLMKDNATAETAREIMQARGETDRIKRAEKLITLINSLEEGVRKEIRIRSNEVITEISADIKAMWSILHPQESIEDVRLYLPDGADKAIDIALKFYGKDLESPRLTLSEGYRNSLGLCIFLAMAKREASDDRPIFLDDVVVSLDRNHRGMIVELLDKEFDGRQVIILTHDRDWYTELRQQLGHKGWTFKVLLPYRSPTVGIRWSDKATTFHDARGQLETRPDAAGSDARKIMDVELPLVAEKLKMRMLFLRFERNDRRNAHEFLEHLIAEAKKCFQRRRDGKEYVFNAEAVEALKTADLLLISWGNHASHSFDVVRAEAAKLVDACETACESLRCTSCGKPTWFAEAAGAEWVQCQCGNIRWRYGKG